MPQGEQIAALNHEAHGHAGEDDDASDDLNHELRKPVVKVAARGPVRRCGRAGPLCSDTDASIGAAGLFLNRGGPEL
jgi:hypothetical protein